VVARALGRPVVLQPNVVGHGFNALRDAACADLQRRFADPLRVVVRGAVRMLSVLDALVFVHDTARRHVCVGAWQPDGTLAINTLNRVEIGRPLAGFAWLDVLLAQWREEWASFGARFRRPCIGNRLRKALRCWMRNNVDLPAQRRLFSEALALEPRMVWMAERLGPNEPHGWLFTDRYNAVGRHFQQLEWVLADSPSLFRLVGLALLERRLKNPDEPVASTRQMLRTLGISDAAWRQACRLGPRLYDVALAVALPHMRFQACVAALRLLMVADLQPLPKALQQVLYWQHALPDMDVVDFHRNWCSFPDWFIRSAARAARQAEGRGEVALFIDEEFLPAVEWLCEEHARPDDNQVHAGWAWIQRAVRGWSEDPARLWRHSSLFWRSLIEVENVDGFNAYALRDPQSLIEEGRVMHHCVARYVDACARGTFRVFSLRDASTGGRVATVLLELFGDDRWIVGEARERMNRLCTGAARRAAERLADRYSEAAARRVQEHALA
jgi:hypothetical protein